MRTHGFASLRLFPFLAILAALLGLAACGSTTTTITASGPAKPLIAKDAIGSAITIPASAPKRIITETPADSEILGALGLDSSVVAVDYYTDTPADLAAKPKITDGQSFNLNVEAITGYKPDLLLGYGGYFKTDEQKLQALGIQVVDLPLVTTVEDSVTELRLVGQIAHADAKAQQVAAVLTQRISAVTSKAGSAQHETVYMEDGTYNGQFSTFGNGSYGDELIRLAGGTNIFASDSDSGGYPNVSGETIIHDNPEVIVLAEGAQFGGDPKAAAARPGWSSIAAVQSGHLYAVDTNDFSRPDAPRMVKALETLAKLLHPELFA
jgi:iron complex transport system substrate-binding protein